MMFLFAVLALGTMALAAAIDIHRMGPPPGALA